MVHYGNENGPSTHDLLDKHDEVFWGVSYEDYQFDLIFERMVDQEEVRTGKKQVMPVYLNPESKPYIHFGYEKDGSSKQVLINDFQQLEGKVMVYADNRGKNVEWKELEFLVLRENNSIIEEMVR